MREWVVRERSKSNVGSRGKLVRWCSTLLFAVCWLRRQEENEIEKKNDNKNIPPEASES